MNFFKVILISGFPAMNWAFPDDAQGIPLPFHLLCFQYPTPHIQQPGNGVPNISCPDLGPLAGGHGKGDLLISLSGHFRPVMAGILHAYECVTCPQHLLISEHPRYRISGPTNHCTLFSSLPLKHGGDIWPHKLYDNSNYLLYGNSLV
jgi:hypothetical protein